MTHFGGHKPLLTGPPHRGAAETSSHPGGLCLHHMFVLLGRFLWVFPSFSSAQRPEGDRGRVGRAKGVRGTAHHEVGAICPQHALCAPGHPGPRPMPLPCWDLRLSWAFRLLPLSSLGLLSSFSASLFIPSCRFLHQPHTSPFLPPGLALCALRSLCRSDLCSCHLPSLLPGLQPSAGPPVSKLRKCVSPRPWVTPSTPASVPSPSGGHTGHGFCFLAPPPPCLLQSKCSINICLLAVDQIKESQ